MRAYAYIVHKLLRVLQKLPPEATPAAILAAVQLSVLLAGLPWILDLLVGTFVMWYLGKMFDIHVWPELPPDHQRFLLKMREIILFKPPDRGRAP